MIEKEKFVDFVKKFSVGMREDYRQCWIDYPAVIVWTAIIAFLTGLFV